MPGTHRGSASSSRGHGATRKCRRRTSLHLDVASSFLFLTVARLFSSLLFSSLVTTLHATYLKPTGNGRRQRRRSSNSDVASGQRGLLRQHRREERHRHQPRRRQPKPQRPSDHRRWRVALVLSWLPLTVPLTVLLTVQCSNQPLTFQLARRIVGQEGLLPYFQYLFVCSAWNWGSTQTHT